MKIRPKVQVLSVPSEINRSASRWLLQEVKSLIRNSYDRIAVDLNRLETIDAVGLAALHTVIKTSRRLGGQVVLFGVQPKVQALFEITRLHQTVDLYDSEAVAITRLAGGFDQYLKAA